MSLTNQFNSVLFNLLQITYPLHHCRCFYKQCHILWSFCTLKLPHMYTVFDSGLHRGLHPDGPRPAVRSVHTHVQHRQGECALLLEPHHLLRRVQGQDALPRRDAARHRHQRSLPPPGGDVRVQHQSSYHQG